MCQKVCTSDRLRGEWRVGLLGEFARMGMVSLGVLLLSGPVRGELADKLLCDGVECITDRLRAVVGEATSWLLEFLGFVVGVWLLAAATQRACRLQQYVFHCEVDRRLAQISARHVSVAVGLVLALGFA